MRDFHDFFTIYVVEVKEFIIDILTELRCLSDLDNPSQLPVWEVLMILSYEFLKFSHYNSCFRDQGIHCWYFYRAVYHVWVISKIQVNFWFKTYSEVLDYCWMCLIDVWNFLTIHVFGVKESIVDISTELPCVGDLENPGWLPVLRIIWRHSYWDTMFRRPQKFRSPSGSRGFRGYPTFVPWQKCS